MIAVAAERGAGRVKESLGQAHCFTHCHTACTLHLGQAGILPFLLAVQAPAGDRREATPIGERSKSAATHTASAHDHTASHTATHILHIPYTLQLHHTAHNHTHDTLHTLHHTVNHTLLTLHLQPNIRCARMQKIGKISNNNK